MNMDSPNTEKQDEEWSFDLSLCGKKHFEILSKQLDDVLNTSFEKVESLDSDLARKVNTHIQLVKSKDKAAFNEEIDLLHKVLCWMSGEVSSILKYNESNGKAWRMMYKAFSLAQNYAFVGTANKKLVSAEVKQVDTSNSNKFTGGRKKGARNRPKDWEIFLKKTLEMKPKITAHQAFHELLKLEEIELSAELTGEHEKYSFQVEKYRFKSEDCRYVLRDSIIRRISKKLIK